VSDDLKPKPIEKAPTETEGSEEKVPLMEGKERMGNGEVEDSR